MSTQLQQPLTHENRAIPVQLMLLAAPMIASMISRTLMSFVDFAMVSTLGTDAQAAIMPAGILLFCFVAFGMGALQAVNTLVAQCFGKNKPHECAAYTWQGLYLSLAFGSLVLPLWFALPPLFAWIGHSPAVRDMEITYAQIGLFHIGPAIAATATSGFFAGIHKPAVNFIATLIANLFNTAANYVLIFGHFGFPEMGIAGAAWATVAATFLHLAITIGWMFLPAYRKPYNVWPARHLSLERLKRLLRIGTPIGVQFTTDIFGWAVFTNLLVGMFGTVHLAANNVAFKFMELAFMPAIGVGVALTAAVGKCIGQRRPDRAKQFVNWCLIILFVYMGTVGFILLFLRHQLVGLISDDPAVIEWGGRILVFAAIFQFNDAMNVTYMHALRGAGDNLWAAKANFILVIVLLLGSSWILARLVPQWQSVGPWTGATAYIMILALVMWARYRWGPWEKIDLFS